MESQFNRRVAPVEPDHIGLRSRRLSLSRERDGRPADTGSNRDAICNRKQKESPMTTLQTSMSYRTGCR